MDSINELIVKNVSTVFFIEPLGLNLNILDSYGLIDAYRVTNKIQIILDITYTFYLRKIKYRSLLKF